LNYVQQALIDAGVVQDAYNAPQAALLLTWLLERKTHPSRDEVSDVLSSLFIRDTGYELTSLQSVWLAVARFWPLPQYDRSSVP
jgi:putative selenate reductase molybdopterin-binding subunit